MFKWVLVFCMCCIVLVAEAATKQVYRYKNHEGVTVIDNKIPAEFTGQGYEIMTISGKVIKVVPPSLSPEEAERLKAEKLAHEERMKADIELKRSYSGISDIDAAKERNIQSLQANIAILQNTLETTKQDLINETAKAASFERSGRKINPVILKKIENLEVKEKEISQQIIQREAELKVVSDKFDADRKRFIEITQDPAASSSAASSSEAKN